MGLGLLLVAAGAIVRFAVTKEVTGINLKAVGVILMIIGALAIVLSFFSGVMLNDFGVHGRCG
ncbi:MAG: hypothetical protein M3N98_02970 [Actinomycetota bacterium]|nr:hypothetical protein [Actinomycetota bacterium]